MGVRMLEKQGSYSRQDMTVLRSVRKTMAKLMEILGAVYDKCVIMLPVSQQCARRAVIAKVEEHVEWLQNDRTPGGPMFGNVSVSQTTLRQLSEAVIPDIADAKDMYLEVNNGAKLVSSKSSACWTLSEKAGARQNAGSGEPV